MSPERGVGRQLELGSPPEVAIACLGPSSRAGPSRAARRQVNTSFCFSVTECCAEEGQRRPGLGQSLRKLWFPPLLSPMLIQRDLIPPHSLMSSFT